MEEAIFRIEVPPVISTRLRGQESSAFVTRKIDLTLRSKEKSQSRPGNQGWCLVNEADAIEDRIEEG
ncbi:hypothetical protein ACETRX_35090 [Labrys portucalensis]|uniref:AbrB/MazE/SpoVT family DNA-binding domain-containing protein n=1 Tax=Labrys neptuniae TaxID=376174 RepID=A0ABV6ZRQ0_9HYPH